MKSILAVAAVLAALNIAPAYALTPQQVQAIIGGFSCAGNTCTLKTNGTEVRDLPDTIVPSPTVSHGPVWSECGFSQITLNVGGKPFCVADYTSWMNKGGAGPTVIDGGTGTVPVCTTKTAVIGFSGGSFSVDLSSTKADGACSH